MSHKGSITSRALKCRLTMPVWSEILHNNIYDRFQVNANLWVGPAFTLNSHINPSKIRRLEERDKYKCITQQVKENKEHV